MPDIWLKIPTKMSSKQKFDKNTIFNTEFEVKKIRLLLPILYFSYRLYFTSLLRMLYNGSIRPPGTVLISLDKYAS